MFIKDELELIQEALDFYEESIANDPTLTPDEKYDKFVAILFCSIKIDAAILEESCV